ncbi:hypothetical protein SEMRO_260_G101600.1 [Seminavis robusta]|uniref:Uncharacterized protein n=1 Tax=Seminavis robusta TaxID=568900 RepID=A0A9N8HBG7_9STRA|nr:hypothetical protein SEMRO_260_G101600.1 [Seminavis robusta]|eukprot:Sro260_g101600.1 n/a (861) ;mRNA; f:51028-54155
MDLGVDHVKNGIFQQILAWLTLCFRYCWKKIKGGDSNEDGALDVVDVVDPSGGNKFTTQLGQGGGANTGVVAGATGMAAAGAGTSAGAGAGAGAGAANASTVVGQMATQAATSAAGATATATSAAAASAGFAASVTSAVASFGVASQIGMALGVVAVSAAAISGGMAIKEAVSVDANATAPAVVDDSVWVPPNCSPTSQLKEGFVELKIRGMPEDALPQHKETLEAIFRDLYNNLTGMCLDPFSRVLHEAELRDWTTEETVVLVEDIDQVLDINGTTTNTNNATNGTIQKQTSNNTSETTNDATTEQPNSTFPSSGNTSGLAPSLSRRRLQLQAQIDMSQFFNLFAASFGYSIEPVLFEIGISGPGQSTLQVVFATTMAVSSGDRGEESEVVVLSIGNAEIEPHIEAVEENESILMTPFISDELALLAECVSEDKVEEDPTDKDELCKQLQQVIALETNAAGENIDEKALVACFETPTNPVCQEVLAAALDAVANNQDVDSFNADVGNTEGINTSDNSNSNQDIDSVNSATSGTEEGVLAHDNDSDKGAGNQQGDSASDTGGGGDDTADGPVAGPVGGIGIPTNKMPTVESSAFASSPAANYPSTIYEDSMGNALAPSAMGYAGEPPSPDSTASLGWESDTPAVTTDFSHAPGFYPPSSIGSGQDIGVQPASQQFMSPASPGGTPGLNPSPQGGDFDSVAGVQPSAKKPTSPGDLGSAPSGQGLEPAAIPQAASLASAVPNPAFQLDPTASQPLSPNLVVHTGGQAHAPNSLQSNPTILIPGSPILLVVPPESPTIMSQSSPVANQALLAPAASPNLNVPPSQAKLPSVKQCSSCLATSSFWCIFRCFKSKGRCDWMAHC